MSKLGQRQLNSSREQAGGAKARQGELHAASEADLPAIPTNTPTKHCAHSSQREAVRRGERRRRPGRALLLRRRLLGQHLQGPGLHRCHRFLPQQRVPLGAGVQQVGQCAGAVGGGKGRQVALQRPQRLRPAGRSRRAAGRAAAVGWLDEACSTCLGAHSRYALLARGEQHSSCSQRSSPPPKGAITPHVSVAPGMPASAQHSADTWVGVSASSARCGAARSCGDAVMRTAMRARAPSRVSKA